MRRPVALYHIAAPGLLGSTLYSLHRLEKVLPEVAAEARKKYVGREALPLKPVPPLGCQWMDLVMFVPVHPEELRDALRSRGHSYPKRWIELDHKALNPASTIILDPGNSPAEEQFLPYCLEKLEARSSLSDAQLRVYEAAAPGTPFLLFGHTAHVLHCGDVAFDPTRILEV